MSSSINSTAEAKSKWVYASLTVVDGLRRLKPSHVASDRLIFAEPPHLTSSNIQIILTNGDEEQQQDAQVLPHDTDATRIPIRLVAATAKNEA